jgi:hypothetical protein
MPKTYQTKKASQIRRPASATASSGALHPITYPAKNRIGGKITAGAKPRIG